MNTEQATHTPELYCVSSAVSCPHKKKKGVCGNCVDISRSSKFLLDNIKPKSGQLSGVAINMKHVAYLLEKFYTETSAALRKAEGK